RDGIREGLDGLVWLGDNRECSFSLSSPVCGWRGTPAIDRLDAAAYTAASEHSFYDGRQMPRVTLQHEQQVRQRILAAALRVFGARGFRRSTMQDVVHESGLSVGAIYTYFKSKDELFLAMCDLTVEDTMAALAARLPAGATVADKLAIAVGFFLDTIDAYTAIGGGTTFLVDGWTRSAGPPPSSSSSSRHRRPAARRPWRSPPTRMRPPGWPRRPTAAPADAHRA